MQTRSAPPGGVSKDHADPTAERRSGFEDKEGNSDQSTSMHEKQQSHDGPYTDYEEMPTPEKDQIIGQLRATVQHLLIDQTEARRAASLSRNAYEANRANAEQELRGLKELLVQAKAAATRADQQTWPHQDGSSCPAQPETSQLAEHNDWEQLKSETGRQEEMKPSAVTDRPGSLATHVKPRPQGKVDWWDQYEDPPRSEGAVSDSMQEDGVRAQTCNQSYAPPEMSGNPPRPSTNASEMASLLKYMQDQQASMDRERRQDMGLLVRQIAETRKGKHEHRPGVPPKLRTEGQPKWPSSRAIYPFCMFAEDFKAWIALLGLDEMLEKHPSDPSVNRETDTLTLRYIAASVTNSTIATHVSSTFRGQGRAAWEYLNPAYGLPSIVSQHYGGILKI